MADPARLIQAFFAAKQPTLKLPDGTWWGMRPNDDRHDLHDLVVEPERIVLDLGSDFERRLGFGLRIELDGAVEVEEVRRPGVHELELRGFRRCVLENRRGGRQEWTQGVLTFVGWVPQGQRPEPVLG